MLNSVNSLHICVFFTIFAKRKGKGGLRKSAAIT